MIQKNTLLEVADNSGARAVLCIGLLGVITSYSIHYTKLYEMDKGLRFAIREGGRTVGSGVVSEILE